MGEERYDPLKEIVSETPPADGETTREPPAAAAAPREIPLCDLTAERDMTGGAVLPHNAHELAEDPIDQASLESFPASDSPGW